MASLLVTHIKNLVLAEDQSVPYYKGAAMSTIPILENAWLLVEDGLFSSFGTMENCPERADEVINAEGRMVFPSFCDSHTHLVFAASREKEFVDRIKGLSYEEIARRGGGILNSAAKLQSMSEDELYNSALKRLTEVMAFGTGAIEIKSGYGLSVDSELKMLKVVQRLKEVASIPIKATFLGAHALPLEYPL